MGIPGAVRGGGGGSVTQASELAPCWTPTSQITRDGLHLGREGEWGRNCRIWGRGHSGPAVTETAPWALVLWGPSAFRAVLRLSGDAICLYTTVPTGHPTPSSQRTTSDHSSLHPMKTNDLNILQKEERVFRTHIHIHTHTHTHTQYLKLILN